MKNIEQPHFMRRFLAAFMDGLLFIFLFSMIHFVVTPPIRNKITHYVDLEAETNNYQVFSHLYVYYDGEKVIEVKDFKDDVNEAAADHFHFINDLYVGYGGRDDIIDTNYVLSHIEYFYCNFITGQNIEIPEAVGTVSESYLDEHHFRNKYYDSVLDDEGHKAKDIYNVQYVYKEVFKECEYFEINSENHIVKKEGVEENTCKDYFNEGIKTSLFTSNARIEGVRSHLQSLKCYKEAYNRWGLIRTLSIIIAYVFSICVVYLLFPMIFRNGATLGKLTTGICLVNKLGYKVTRPQVLLRFLAFALEISFFSFIIGIQLFTSVLTLSVGVAILMIATLISKEKKAPHDYLAGTLVVDYKKSTFFKNANEEAEYEADMNKHLEQYKDAEVVDAHVIQIGSKVIDEEENKTIDKK